MKRNQKTSTEGRLRLKNLLFWGKHGHLPSERELGSRFEVDIDLTVNLELAARSDRLEDTVDMAEVYQIARKHIEGKSRRLIETLAAVIAGDYLKLRGVKKVTVRVRKIAPPLPGATGGIMEAEVTRVS